MSVVDPIDSSVEIINEKGKAGSNRSVSHAYAESGSKVNKQVRMWSSADLGYLQAPSQKEMWIVMGMG